MLKDKEFIGRICRNAKTNSPIDFSVLKVIRSKENSILGFEVSAQQGNVEQFETIVKDDVEFQANDQWIKGTDIIIQLLEKKINDLRRQLKINSTQRKK